MKLTTPYHYYQSKIKPNWFN